MPVWVCNPFEKPVMRSPLCRFERVVLCSSIKNSTCICSIWVSILTTIHPLRQQTGQQRLHIFSKHSIFIFLTNTKECIAPFIHLSKQDCLRRSWAVFLRPGSMISWSARATRSLERSPLGLCTCLTRWWKWNQEWSPGKVHWLTKRCWFLFFYSQKFWIM